VCRSANPQSATSARTVVTLFSGAFCVFTIDRHTPVDAVQAYARYPCSTTREPTCSPQLAGSVIGPPAIGIASPRKQPSLKIVTFAPVLGGTLQGSSSHVPLQRQPSRS